MRRKLHSNTSKGVFAGTKEEADQIHERLVKKLGQREYYVLLRYLQMDIPDLLTQKYGMMSDTEHDKALDVVLHEIYQKK